MTPTYIRPDTGSERREREIDASACIEGAPGFNGIHTTCEMQYEQLCLRAHAIACSTWHREWLHMANTSRRSMDSSTWHMKLEYSTKSYVIECYHFVVELVGHQMPRRTQGEYESKFIHQNCSAAWFIYIV
jgi:hypothetical protein